jgi:serine/threonine protein kinase
MPPFVGEGTYGCVFKPPVSCKNNQNKTNTTTVGKVFKSEKEFKKEVDINNIVLRIDPKHKFTLPLVDTCKINNFTYKDQVNHCRLIDNPYNSIGFSQIIYKDGGENLKMVMNTVKGTPHGFINMLKLMKPVFLGLKQMIAHGYVHQDIKPQNMLYKNNRVYLIDFGLINTSSRIYVEDQRYILKYDYPYYPPEYKLWVYSNSFTTFYNRVLNNYQFITVVNNKKYNLLNVIQSMGIDIKKELKDAYSLSANRYMQPFKVDIFSLGIVLLELYVWSGIFDKTYVKNSKANEVNNKIRNFICDMIRFDVSKRMDINTLLIKYKKLISLFK